MAEQIGYCGIDCAECPAYKATQTDDQDGLAKTAAEWSERFGEQIGPEDITCDGCTPTEGRKATYCGLCEIAKCCIEKAKENCAHCNEYICEKLAKFFADAPEAKENLEKLREDQ